MNLTKIIMTKHAEEMLKKRFNCNEIKLKKIIRKAWYNKEKVNPKLEQTLNNRHQYSIIEYKTFNGFIFVFAIKYDLNINKVILITVYNPKIFGDLNFAYWG